jgi:hypothetical protein
MRLTLFVGLNFALWGALAVAKTRTFAEAEERSAEKTRAKRVELLSRAGAYEPLGARLRPGRAYSVWNDRLRQRIYVLTDESGQLASPVQALAPGSVLSGNQLGAEAAKRYRLTKKGTWEPTRVALQLRVWELKQKPRYRIFLSAVEPRPPAAATRPSSRASK